MIGACYSVLRYGCVCVAYSAYGAYAYAYLYSLVLLLYVRRRGWTSMAPLLPTKIPVPKGKDNAITMTKYTRPHIGREEVKRVRRGVFDSRPSSLPYARARPRSAAAANRFLSFRWCRHRHRLFFFLLVFFASPNGPTRRR